ncbi:MAG: hypothetical protein HYR70_01870 [Chloroflexi bacterium]|nr:hypothetical protein [Chloroflexota bacterium]MBI3338858.1 hypothetical protein [Chloroflexota bacterium]
MTDWDQITEYIHNAMQAIESAHATTQKLQSDPNSEALAAFQAQMKELIERLTRLQKALDHESDYVLDELADRLAETLSGKPVPYRRTQKV